MSFYALRCVSQWHPCRNLFQCAQDHRSVVCGLLKPAWQWQLAVVTWRREISHCKVAVCRNICTATLLTVGVQAKDQIHHIKTNREKIQFDNLKLLFLKNLRYIHVYDLYGNIQCTHANQTGYREFPKITKKQNKTVGPIESRPKGDMLFSYNKQYDSPSHVCAANTWRLHNFYLIASDELPKLSRSSWQATLMFIMYLHKQKKKL